MSNGYRPPDGQARRSQLLLGSGPGALVDLVDDAVIMGGLDSWRYRREQDGFIAEPRLQAKAQALLSTMPWWNHTDVRLRLPPECDGDEPTQAVGIAVGRFPKWFLCQNSECRSIVPLKGLDKPAMRKHSCQYNKKSAYPVVPIRFVSACTNGHVQDIEWQWFVHRERHGEEVGGRRAWCTRVVGANRPNDPLGEEWTAELYMLQVGTTGDLADFVVGCRKCGRQRGLQDLAQKNVLGPCQGHRPWLGYNAREPGCGEQAKLLTRTASNAYFPNPISVLSIPDPSLQLRAAVELVWDFVKVATAETVGVFRQLPNVKSTLEGFTDAEVVAEIDRRRLGLPVPTAPIRETEWRALVAAPAEAPGDHPRPDERWFARRIDLPIPSFLDRVVLVKHLTEVRGQVGFTRIEPIAGDAEGEYTLDVRTAPVAQYADWIPAVEILGEGVFLAFDGEALDRWADPKRNPAVARRAAQFSRGFLELNASRTRPIPFSGIRLVMLHTLSHLLINSISLECGYAASSIRERLYCATETRDGVERTTRAGILLYTGSPGSEGSLGGLVEVGRNILHHLRRAAEMALLCSNDPVCAQHHPDDDQEGRYREGAACHGCVLIGEPSCERMNQDLDRSLVVPTVGGEDAAAFLREWVASWH
jgi:hypothetical protein